MPNITRTTTPTHLDGPYFSPRRDRHLDLNNQASIGNALLSCTNLSYLWERSFNTPQPDNGTVGKPDYRHFSSVESLQAHAPGDIEALCRSRNLARALFVRNDVWGMRIADAFKRMDAVGRRHWAFQVLTPNHVMAFGLLTKPRLDAPCYVAKFYDPNRTATHQRAHAGDPDAFARLTASDFFLEDPLDMERYAMGADSGSVVFLGDALPDPARQPVQVERVDAPTLLQLMDLGLAEGIVRYGELVTERQLGPQQVTALLAAHTDGGTPALSVAMQQDHGEAIRAYGEVLLRAGLGPADAAGLLACEDHDKGPGLFRAMQDDNTDAIRAWGEVFRRCRLDAHDRAKLLAAERADGTTGLMMAMRWDNAGAVSEHGKILLGSGLPTTTLVELLAGKGRHAMPALHVAVKVGSTAAIRAYGEVVAESGLDRLELGDLLGITGNTAPAMSAAFREAPPASRKAYADLLLSMKLHS